MTSGFNITPSELDKGGSHLEDFSSKLDANASKLDTTHQNLSTHASSDRSGLGKVIVNFADKTGTAFSGMAKQVSRVVKGSGTRLKASGKAHAETESNVKQAMDGVHSNKTDITVHPSSAGGTTKPSSAAGPTFQPPKSPKGEGGGAPAPGGGKGPGGGPGGGPAGGGGPGGHGGGGPTTPSSAGAGTPDPAATARPPLSGNKPPSASSQYSDKFQAKSQLPTPSPYNKALPDGTNAYVPPDRSRGAKVTQLNDQTDKLKRDPQTGLITHVGDKTVKQYTQDLSQQRAGAAANPQQAWKNDHPGQPMPGAMKNVGKEGTCSAVAIDLKTGLVTQGVNGKGNHVIPDDNLHPLLQQNLQDLRAYKHPVVADANGTPAATRFGNGTYDGQAHYSNPASHAEVKAVNELLWQRQAAAGNTPLPASTLQELRFDPRWTGQVGSAGVGDAAPACANCNTILHGVPSYTGRCNYDPADYRYGNPNVPPAP